MDRPAPGLPIDLVMGAIAAGLEDDPVGKGAEYLVEIGKFGTPAIFGTWCAFGEAIKSLMVEQKQTNGNWALQITDQESGTLSIDDAPPVVRAIGRFLTAALNDDMPTRWAIFESIRSTGMDELGEASVTFLGVVHSCVRYKDSITPRGAR